MKKVTKGLRSVFFAVLIMLLCVGTFGCMPQIEADESFRVQANALTQALMEKDAEAAYEQIDSQQIDQETFDSAFADMINYLGDFSTFEVGEATGYNYNLQNGVSYERVTFLVDTDHKDFYIAVTQMNESAKVGGFHVTLVEALSPSYTGTVTTMSGANAVQWGVLIGGLALLGFAIWMLVDCARRKIRKKVLWLLLIIFGFLSLSVSLGDMMNFSFNIGFFLSTSALRIYSNGAITLSLVIPVGAIVYFFLRKKLTRSAEAEVQPTSEQPVATAENSADEQQKDLLEVDYIVNDGEGDQ